MQVYSAVCIVPGGIDAISAARCAHHYAARASHCTVYYSGHSSVRVVKIRYIYGIPGIGSRFGYGALPRGSPVGGGHAAVLGAVVSTYKYIRPACLAGIARKAGKAYTFVVCAYTPVLAGSAAAFVFTTGNQHYAENAYREQR